MPVKSALRFPNHRAKAVTFARALPAYVIDVRWAGSSKQTGADWPSVLRNCINCIFENKISDARKTFPAVLRALQSKQARLALCNELSHHVSGTKAMLEHQQFDLVVRLMNCALQDDSSMDEHGIIQFAYTCIQEHVVWQNQQFWEAAFYQDVQKDIKALYAARAESLTPRLNNELLSPTSPRDNKDFMWHRRSLLCRTQEATALEIAAEQMRIWNSIDPEKQKELITCEENTMYSQAIHYANRMVYLLIPLDNGHKASKQDLFDDERASNSIANSVAESDSVDAESGFEDQDPGETGSTVIKMVSRFIDKVCNEGGVTRDHIRNLHQMIPGVVHMHIETLEAVHRESKRLPPIQKPKILTPNMLAGEESIMDGLRVYMLPDGREEGTAGLLGGPPLLPAEGAIFLTNYRIIFKGIPCDSFGRMSLPMTDDYNHDDDLSIDDFETGPPSITPAPADAKTLERLQERSYVRDWQRLGMCSSNTSPTSKPTPDQFRLTTVNSIYMMCRSYPALLVVPATVSDESIRRFCRCYRQGRIPGITWRHPRTKALLLRGAGHHGKSVMGMLKSHPTPATSTETTSSTEQEKYLSALVSATPIFSHRPGSAWGMSDSSLSIDSLLLAAEDPLTCATLTPEVARRSNPFNKAIGTLGVFPRSSGGKGPKNFGRWGSLKDRRHSSQASLIGGQQNRSNIRHSSDMESTVDGVHTLQRAALYILGEKAQMKGIKVESAPTTDFIPVEYYDVRHTKAAFKKLMRACIPSSQNTDPEHSFHKPQSHLPCLEVWNYYLDEDLHYGPNYDLEIIQMDSQQEEEAEAADGINKSRKIVSLGYDNVNKAVPDAFSHLLEEIHKLESDLGHLPQKWKVLWDKLELPITDSLTRHASFSTALVRSHGRLVHKRSTLEILMRGKMVGAAETSLVYSHPHRFERYNYTTPTYCDLCTNLLWGPVKTGMRCMDCGYSCHEKCMENVPKNCTKYKAVADSTTSQTMQGNAGDNGSVSSGDYAKFSGSSGAINETSDSGNTAPAEIVVPTVNALASSLSRQVALLSTALVDVHDSQGHPHTLRVLIDNGSEASFITVKAARNLNLKRQHDKIQIQGIGANSSIFSSGSIHCKISPHGSCQPAIHLEAHIIPHVASVIPSQSLQFYSWDHINNLKLADPNFYISRHVDLLLGADVYAQLIRPGLVLAPSPRCPSAFNTIFGWVLSGSVQPEQTNERVINSFHVKIMEDCPENDLESTMRQFWQVEEVPMISTSPDDEL
ncbi:hypothetical protein NQ318_016033 [Aromia moschata]|uniref:Uncharacterized protein n=1 Tax=Aromia moschata TaxID=1265417 RepID=A0AAV8X660_9CUCU|nr:hypothetical protein NQ318_016033 [Aromia moschata]